MKRAPFWTHAAVLLFGWPADVALGQTSSAARAVVTDTAPKPTARFPAKWYPPPSEQVYTLSVERGKPYVAVLVTASTFVDPKTGVTKSSSQSVGQMRDSQGRRREETEMPRLDGQGRTVMAHEVTVHDPVSHCEFRWMEPWVVTGSAAAQPVASVTCMPLTMKYTNQNIWRDGIVETQQHKRDKFSKYVMEPLGHRNTEGLDAVGTRTTTTRLDNSGAPMGTVVTEIWYSPEVDELLSMQMTAEAGATRHALPSFELTKIRREEPDPALFYPPAEYRIDSTNPEAR